jgi:hypothetical protein
MQSMSSQTQSTQPAPTPRPLSASSSFSSATNNYGPGGLGPAPIMPGSAMRLLSQGRAQGLFTPSTSTAPSRQNTYAAPTPAYNPTSGYNATSPYAPTVLSPTPSNSSQQLKRTRSDMEIWRRLGRPPLPNPHPTRIHRQTAPPREISPVRLPALLSSMAMITLHRQRGPGKNLHQ